MDKKINSPIRNVSALKYNEQAYEKEFEWWGPSPEQARKIMVDKPKGLIDKTMTLKEAVDKHVKDGISIGIGGFVNTRVPVAIIHEIIRHGAKDLTLCFASNSICAELLAGAMILDPDHLSIKRAEIAFWGYEIIGLAPMLRYLTSNSLIQIDDYTNYGLSARFKAGAMGLPFIPVTEMGGSDMELVNRGKMIECPFTGKNVYLVPALNPDLGILHVTACDIYGNGRIFGSLANCPDIAMASTYNIVTAEEIIPNENIRNYPNMTEIPYPAVDAVIKQPFGSFPGASYGHYWFDMAHIAMFRSICEEFRKTGNKDKLKRYYDEYIFGCETYDDFLSKLPYKKLREIKELDGGQPLVLA